MKKQNPLHASIVFWLGIVGLVFYALGPILFPHSSIRQPELLPVYGAMLGIGTLLKKGDDK